MPAPWSEPAGPFRAATQADFAACRALIREGSKSFHAASLLLPAAIRPGAHAIYAFCRLSDDAADSGTGRAAALARQHRRLDAVYRGQPEDSPVDRALASCVRRHGVPKAAFEGLLEGLGWDLDGRRYETLADLHAYAARVAGTVGILMSALMGVHDTGRLARACDLGVAMQLTNIARDVGEDARNGRVYLPLQWLREEGIDPDAFVSRPAFTPALGRVIERVLAAAEGLYRRSDSGIARLPASCRPAIAAARDIYAAIGHRLLRAGLDSVSVRTVVPLGVKAGLLARAWTGGLTAGLRPVPEALLQAPPLAATRFLVQAGAGAAPAGLRADPLPASLLPWAVADQSAGWVMDLFQSMGQRDRRASGHPSALADLRLAGAR